MKIELRRGRGLAFVCLFLAVASPPAEAADPSRLVELRGVWQAHFNHDASRLVVRTRKGEVGLWDAKKGTRIAGDAALKKPSKAYFMSPDAKKVSGRIRGRPRARLRCFDRLRRFACARSRDP